MDELMYVKEGRKCFLMHVFCFYVKQDGAQQFKKTSGFICHGETISNASHNLSTILQWIIKILLPAFYYLYVFLSCHFWAVLHINYILPHFAKLNIHKRTDKPYRELHVQLQEKTAKEQIIHVNKFSHGGSVWQVGSFAAPQL